VHVTDNSLTTSVERVVLFVVRCFSQLLVVWRRCASIYQAYRLYSSLTVWR